MPPHPRTMAAQMAPVLFSLVVDDFGIKYVGKQHVNHLLEALKEHYEVSKDWDGKLYCGITLDWDHKNRTVDLSMPGYIQAALHKYHHVPAKRPQHAPTRVEHQIMAPNNNLRHQKPLQNRLTPEASSASKKLQEHYCTMPWPSTQPSSPHLAQLQPNSPRQHKQPNST